MLFILTGDIQIGKTRWLTALVDELSSKGVTSYGVLAPGIWKDKGDSFEKLGIDNRLLPDDEIVHFARRRDLAESAGIYDGNSQSGKMGMMWAIDDSAIERVNQHFEQLARRVEAGDSKPGLLVVDELGMLELKAGKGLYAALATVEAGPTSLYQHAIVVVRNTLLDIAQQDFFVWDEIQPISPTQQTATQIKVLFGV